MASVTKYPTSASTQAVAPEDDADWDNPNNIKADDSLDASCSLPGWAISYRLKAQGFGFNIPLYCAIDGIKVEFKRYRLFWGSGIGDYRVRLLDASGNPVGDSKGGAYQWPTTPTIQSYGGPADKWNASPTPAMVNDADFGVWLSAGETGNLSAQAFVDFVRMTIYYSYRARAHFVMGA